MNLRRSAIALMPLLALAAIVPRANATIEIRLISGASDTGWLTCGDAGISCPVTPPGTNVIVFVGSVGTYFVNTSTGTQNTAFSPFLDLNSVDTTGTTPPGELTIETLADGYTMQTPGWEFAVNGNGTIGGTATFTAYGGNNNNVCPLGVNTCTPPNAAPANLATIATLGPDPVTATGPNDVAFTNTGTTAATYSLGIAAVIDGATKGTISYDAHLDPVPEPSSVALLGGILLAATGAIRRKLRKA